MERKIGEIFKHGDEWYQCVEGNYCKSCGFYQSNVPALECSKNFFCFGNTRKDKTSVIFKKLVKVGEPYNIGKKVFQRYAAFINPYIFSDEFTINTPVEGLYIGIEIKQNKEEDMKTVKVSKDDLNFLVNKIRYGILPKHTDWDKITSEITDLFSVKDINLSNSENIGKKLKPFDLEAAKAGKPVCTRDGRKARIICFDAKRKDEKNIIALVPSKDYPEFEDLIAYPNNGNYHGGHENDGDLMMLPEKKEGWIVVRRSDIYENEERAKEALLNSHTAMMLRNITWEE